MSIHKPIDRDTILAWMMIAHSKGIEGGLAFEGNKPDGADLHHLWRQSRLQENLDEWFSGRAGGTGASETSQAIATTKNA